MRVEPVATFGSQISTPKAKILSTALDYYTILHFTHLPELTEMLSPLYCYFL